MREDPAPYLVRRRETGTYVLVHHVDGTAGVDVNKVDVESLGKHLGAAHERIRLVAGDLHTEDGLAAVAPNERPFRLLAHQQAGGHGHFSAGDVDPEALAEQAEGKIAHGGEGREVGLVAEVDLASAEVVASPYQFPLSRLKRHLHVLGSLFCLRGGVSGALGEMALVDIGCLFSQAFDDGIGSGEVKLHFS